MSRANLMTERDRFRVALSRLARVSQGELVEEERDGIGGTFLTTRTPEGTGKLASALAHAKDVLAEDVTGEIPPPYVNEAGAKRLRDALRPVFQDILEAGEVDAAWEDLAKVVLRTLGDPRL